MSLQHWTNIGPIRDLRDIERLERIPLAERFDTFDINEWVRRGCDVDPARIAVTFFANGDPRQNPVELSYRDLRARINETANLLDDLGIRENDVVLIMLPNIPEAHIVLLAALARGIACPVNWMLKPEAVQDLIENSHAKVVIALGPTPGFDIWERISSLRDGMKADIRIFSVPGPGGTRLPETDLALAAAAFPSDRLTFDMPRGRNDVVAYVHSGGTTGTPKLVQLTNGGMVHKCWAVTVTMAHETSDVIFADMPLFHIAGFLSCVVLPAVLGSQVVIPTPLGARDKTFLKNYWKFVERMRITFMHAVPATLSLIAQNPPDGEDVSSLRDYSTTGSTALPVEIARTIERNLGIRIVATYGATEFTQNVTQAPRNGDPRYGSSGIRLPDVQIKIVQLDRDGHVQRECRFNEIGSVLVRSPGTTPGYLDPVQGAGVLLGDGWINNGDLGRLDDEGYLWITGRAKDRIIRGGHNIDPAPIEAAAYAHPAVAMAAAVGQPDAYAGEIPVIFVQLKPGADADPQDIRAFLRTRIQDPVAVPREVIVIAEMPLTDVRKIDKVALRRLASRAALDAALRDQLPPAATFEIDVVPDDRDGSRVKINVTHEASESIRAQIASIMGRYALSHEIIG